MTRLEFSAKTKRDAYDRANGCCQDCGIKLRDGEPNFHHILEAWLGGDNSLANCRCLCPRCHKLVTREVSRPRVTKTKHVRDASINARGPKAKIAQRPKERTVMDKLGLPPRRNIFTKEPI